MTSSNIPRLIISFSLLFFSCKDQGADVEPLQVLSVRPLPNTVAFDKAQPITLLFNHDVDFREGAKLLFRYVGDAAQFQVGFTCEECSPVNKSLNVGPGIWKAGRTVEVSVPSSLADINGGTLRQPLYFRFTIAQDSVPFQFKSSSPRSNDTLSVSRNNGFGLSLLFTDYVAPSFFPIISPPATITQVFIVHSAPRDNRESVIAPAYALSYSITDIQVGVTYTVTIPRETKDYEGETLPQDYRLVFYTKP